MSAMSPELIPLDAPTLVEASAGTGKTYAITTYFLRAILEGGLTPEKILVVTYTKAATAELRIRARARIVQALGMLDGPPDQPDALYDVITLAVKESGAPEVERKLRSALGQMDQAAILTIHGFCQRLLQEHPLSFGVELEFEVVENVASLHAELAVDFWATELYDKPEWLLQALRSRKVTLEHLAQLANVATMPGVEVIGPEPREIDDEAVREVLALHRQAGALWMEHRQEILALLQNEGLHASIYKEKKIREAWAPELDALFGRATLEGLPDYFRWLCTANIEKKTKKKKEPPKHPFFDACEALLAAHERIEPRLAYAIYAFQQRFCSFVRDHSRARRDETALYSFDDLLTTVHEAVTERKAVARTIRAAYPIALVDEFQDTDSVQYGIFLAIYGEGAAVYVGDPKQAIYAFRGADIFSYIEAAKNVGERKYTLATNRRSDPGLVQAVNALFSRLQPPFLIEGIGFEGANAHEEEIRTTLAPPLDVVFLSADELRGPLVSCVAPIVANEVALMLESGALIEGRPVQAGDIAVLCRSNNQAIAVTNAMRELHIPTSLDGGASVLSTEVAADLWAVLEAALMPGDSGAVRRALLTPLLGLSAFDLASMNDDAWSAWVSRFREWNDTWHTQGVLRFLRDMLTATNAETSIASRPTARRDLTDLLHLQEILLRGEGERNRDPVGLMQWYRRLNGGTQVDVMVAADDLQQRPDAEAGAVRVTTIHKSKGLEYGVVFCPFTWNDASLFGFDHTAVKFHDEVGSLKVDLGSAAKADHLIASKREAASEAIRLLYVAVTRAKHQCTLFWGPGHRWKDSAFAYLIHDADSPAKLTEEAMRADVEAFVARAGGTAGCRSPKAEKATPRHDDKSGLELTPRPKLRGFDHTSRIASFTSLTGHDEKAPGPSVPDTTSPLFAELPGGARTGLLLHSIFERAELDAFGGEDARTLLEKQLGLFGFDSALATSVQRDLAAVASTPIAADPALPALGELGRGRQLRELEFTLAVGRPNIHELAELLKEHGAPANAPEYHERLARLSSQTLRGFLRGFIDLMFEWEGRWYVADYKSNRLPSYEPSSVIEAVQREHYVLQGQLYSIAAHRYLRQRDRRYDPEKNWGGALFLFVRGMKGPEHTGSSVFLDKQSPELLDAVDAWLGGRDGSR
jgi:exodeoxyribonuclease V beta subunit